MRSGIRSRRLGRQAGVRRGWVAVLAALAAIAGFGSVSKEAQHAEMQALAAQIEEVRAQGQLLEAESLYQQLQAISASLGGDWPQGVASAGQPAAEGRAPSAPQGTIGFIPPAPFGCTGAIVTVSNTTPVAIPTGPATVTSTIAVSGAPSWLWELNVRTFIEHTFNEDLDITLQSPAGTVVTLTTDNGSFNDNVFNGTVWDDQANPGGQVPYATNNGLVTDHAYSNLTLASPLVPEEALTAFRGEDPNGTWTLTISDDAAGNGGQLTSWTLEIAGLSAPPSITSVGAFSNTTPVTIPTGPAVVSSTIAVPAALQGTIQRVVVTTNITHTFNGDLDITLQSPAGTVVTLTTDNGFFRNNVFNGTVWDDQANPGGQVPYTTNNGLVTDHLYSNNVVATPLVVEESLGLFSGESPVGTWTLTISDDSPGNGGQLASWELSITTTACSCALSCPANTTVSNTPGQCGAAVSFGAPAITGGICGAVSCTPASGSNFPVGTTAVSCSSVFGGGSCGFNVTVNDTEPPTVSVPNVTVPNAPGMCSATVSYSPTATDNCGVSSLSCVPPSGSSFPVGTTTVTCTAQDPSGNTGTGTGSVTVNDVQPPTVSVPNVTVPNAPNQCSATVSYTPSFSDNCGVSSSSCTPASGSVFPVGTTTVTCTAQDAAGNSTSGTGTVTVNDVEPPVLTCSPNITVSVPPGSLSTTVTFPPPGVSDNCPGAGAATCVPPSGSAFPVGTTTVNCTATDASGNSGSCPGGGFSVIVNSLAIQAIPTASVWGLAALGLLLAGAAFWVLRRRG